MENTNSIEGQTLKRVRLLEQPDEEGMADVHKDLGVEDPIMESNITSQQLLR